MKKSQLNIAGRPRRTAETPNCEFGTGFFGLEFPPRLTQRESEVLPMLLLGQTRDEIANQYEISPETVKLHTRNILAKFDASSVRDGFYLMNLYQMHHGLGG